MSRLTKWARDCWLTPSEKCSSYVTAETIYIPIMWFWCPLCTRPTRLVGFLSCCSIFAFLFGVLYVIVCSFSFSHFFTVCPSICGFWLPIWYLRTFLTGRYFAQLGHIIMIPRQPVIALTPNCCWIPSEAANIKFIFIGLIRPGLEPTIYHTLGYNTNHYTAYPHNRVTSGISSNSCCPDDHSVNIVATPIDTLEAWERAITCRGGNVNPVDSWTQSN